MPNETVQCPLTFCPSFVFLLLDEFVARECVCVCILSQLMSIKHTEKINKMKEQVYLVRWIH